MKPEYDVVQEPEIAISSRPRKRILIVDDDHSQAEVLALRFHKQGFRTATAHTGEAAIQHARSKKPDLVVLDIRLPDQDGLHVCRQLNDDSETCDIPVILLSGMSRPDIIRRSRGAGCRYFVRKPYDPNAMLVLAENALREREDW